MTWWEIIGIATLFLYMFPWFALHGWILFTRGRGFGGFDYEGTTWTIVFAVIPFVNLYLAIVFFVVPLWDKFKYRKGVPLPTIKDD